MGNINKNKKPSITVSFIIYNNTNKVIEIKKIDVSCGCMKPLIKKFTLKTNDSKKIPIKIDLKHQSGKFDKRVFIRSNTPKKVNIVRIIGNIENI